MTDDKRKYTIRLFPTPSQTKLLWQYVDARWFVWNWALATLEQWRYEFEIAHPSEKYKNDWNRLSREFAILREKTSGLRRLKSHDARSALHDLKIAYQAFFKRVKKGVKGQNPKNPFGFPQPKKRFGKAHGFLVPEGCRIENRRLIALGVRLKLARSIPSNGSVGKAVRITHTAGKWYASFTLDPIKISPQPVPPVNLAGIDTGCTIYAAISDGSEIPNPRWTRQYERKLAHWQRKFCRQKRGSHRRNRIRQRLAKIHAAIANRRKHYSHLHSRRVADKYDAVCIETHSIADQMQARWAKSIADVGQGHFRQCLKYKLPDRGKQLLCADPKFKSTGVCPECHCTVDLKLSERKWTCPDCGTHHHRDFAAAKVLQHEGRRQVTANEMATT